MKYLKRLLLKLIIKHIWNGTQQCDILFTEHEKNAILKEAKLLNDGLLLQYISQKLRQDANKNFYKASTNYDIIFPQAQIYTINLIKDIVTELSTDPRAPKGVNYRTARKLPQE